jgi:tRNA threonylcarbamoyladenosine biosynthesis protein TsaE
MLASGWMRVKKNKITHVSSSPEETALIAKEFGSTLPKGSVVAFFGDLAAGKTTFIKSLVASLANIHENEISSPTFVYLNIYPFKDANIYHFDLYRLRSQEEFLAMGFQEYFDAGGVCLIEWSERIPDILPEQTIKISLETIGHDTRKIEIQ